MSRKKATITRAPHDNQNPYKAMRRATFDGCGLSFEARGVLGYLLMKPDDWRIEIGDLMREGGIGRDKAYKIIAELIELRYLERVDERDKGKFGGATYLLYESPLPEKAETVAPLPEKPYPEKPYPEKPYPEKPTHTKEVYSTKEGKSTKEGVLTPGQAMYAAVCEAIGWDYKTLAEKDKIQAAEAVKALMVAEYTLEDIRRFMVDVWFQDWRWQKNAQRPTLSQLRQEIGKLRSVLPEHIPRPSSTNKVENNMAVIHNVFARIHAQKNREEFSHE